MSTNIGARTGEMTDSAVEVAAQHVHALQRSGAAGERIAPHGRPANPADGWRIQRRVSALRASPVIGWKCGLPPADRWVVAALHECVSSGQAFSAPVGPSGAARIETELAFELSQDLPPREQPYTPADVNAAIGSVRMAVEVLGCRYVDTLQASGPELMADSMWHHLLVLGDVVQVPAQPTFELRIAIEGQPPRTTAARHPDGDPRRPLYWLAEFLRSQGTGMQAGQVVITGSFAGAIELPFGLRAMLCYGEFGEISLFADPL